MSFRSKYIKQRVDTLQDRSADCCFTSLRDKYLSLEDSFAPSALKHGQSYLRLYHGRRSTVQVPQPKRKNVRFLIVLFKLTANGLTKTPITDVGRFDISIIWIYCEFVEILASLQKENDNNIEL